VTSQLHRTLVRAAMMRCWNLKIQSCRLGHPLTVSEYLKLILMPKWNLGGSFYYSHDKDRSHSAYAGGGKRKSKKTKKFLREQKKQQKAQRSYGLKRPLTPFMLFA
jgi:hypothetical protein